MKKKVIIGIVTLVVIAGIVFGFSLFSGNNANHQKYEKAAIDTGDIQALVDTTGTLNPVTIVDVGSQVSGKIANIYVDFNSQVKEGQVIAELDQSTFLTRVQQNEANYMSAKASLEKSKVTLENAGKKLERAKSLFEKNLISFEEFEATETQYFSAKADLQSAEARLEQAKAQLDSSKVDLEYTIIKSPIDGVVINKNVNEGQTVAASFQAPVLFQIANDLSKMQVECSVDEADIGRVKEGQKVNFTVDAFPDERFSGTVRQVRYSPEVIQNVVTYTTIVDVHNPEMKLRPGMTATVSVVVGEAKKAIRVPNAALRFTPELSQEEMKTMFEEIRQARRAERAGTAHGKTQTSDSKLRPKPQADGVSSFPRNFSNIQSRMRDASRVWIEDENAKLKMVFIRTGITDSVYTEVVSGNLEEGQEVIIGENGGEGSNRSNNLMRSTMRFMRH